MCFLFALSHSGCVVCERIPPSLGCDSSSVRVSRPGLDAVLVVIASEMNYLAQSKTAGGEEIVIEPHPPLHPACPSPSCLELLYLQCRETCSICTQIHTPSPNQFLLPTPPPPHTMASAEQHIDAGWFQRLIVHGHMHTRTRCTPALLFIAQGVILS